MRRPTLNSRLCPSCLAAWRSGGECKKCGYGLDGVGRMPTVGEILATPDGDIEWNAVDLSAWSRMIWELASLARLEDP